jgi:hypothetical protein
MMFFQSCFPTRDVRFNFTGENMLQAEEQTAMVDLALTHELHGFGFFVSGLMEMAHRDNRASRHPVGSCETGNPAYLSSQPG